MFSNINGSRLTTLIIIFPLIALLVYGGTTYLFFFFTQQKETKQVLQNYEQTLIDIEKERLKEKVNSLTQFINYYDDKSSDKIKEDVKNIVSVTVNVANNIYKRYKDIKSEKEIKEMITSALQSIKFEGDIGYLFIINLKGDTIVHVDKKMQGTNILKIQDIYGKYIIKEFNKVIAKDGEGFVDYYWYIVSENRKTMHYKISFVKMLDCYDWYVGAGEYLKYMKRFVKQDIIDYISANAHFKNGHFFLFDGSGKMLFQPHKNNIFEISSYKKEGFYVDEKQISYISYIKEFDWFIVANRDMKDIQASIQENKKIAELKRADDTKTNFYLLGFSWLISLLLSLYLSVVINRLLKNYENQINQSNEKLIFQSRQALIGELFSMIAHQWRQPVNKIASILALLRFNLQADKLNAKDIDTKCHEIENSIEFMSETIDDFRTFYKPKDNVESVNLRTLIEQALLFVQNAIEKRDIKVIKELEDIEYVLYQNEFVQVMLNLIKNAIDAIADNGTITITLHKQNNQVLISVQNDGKVIYDSTILKVFDPYFTTKKDSMGLGLYMAKIIIEKHMKGIIKVGKKMQNTLFTIELPLV